MLLCSSPPPPPPTPHLYPQRLTVAELQLRPLPVFHSKYLPRERAETHAQVRARNRKLKNRSSRGDRGH